MLYNVVLASTVQQSDSPMCLHVSPLFWVSFSFRSPRTLTLVACDTQQVLIGYVLYIASIVYMCQFTSDSFSQENLHLRFTETANLHWKIIWNECCS